MRHRATWLLALLAVVSAAGPAHAQSLSPSAPPSTYVTESDRNVYPPPPLPALGPAGYRFSDPTFGSKMLRVTDANTRPDRLGRFWASPSSAETSAWNTDSTKFYVIGGGGEIVPYRFDPRTMTAARMGDTGNAGGGLLLFFGGEPSFSFVDPDVMYGVDWSDRHQFVSYRFSTATQTTVHDMQACLPGVAVHEGNVSVTKDDQRLLDYSGGLSQGLDTHVYVYDRTLGCRWLNTQTGQVGGAWGPTGASRGDSGWLIHNARISKNGKWARITASTASAAGVYFWNIETLDVIACNVDAAPYCAGHLVTGFDTVVNQRGLGSGMDLAIRPMSAPNNAGPLITPLPTPGSWGQDTHPSWNNVQADERQPVCMAVYRPDNLVLSAWDGEIICVRTDGAASTVWRFAHHRSRYVSFWDSPRANVSQDGRFALFTSNWELTLGIGLDGIRDDAFVVQLAPPSAVAPTTYTAPTDRDVRPYPPLPVLGPAGYQFSDPTFGSKMLRVTDDNTRPDRLGRFWASPTFTVTSGWNTDSTKFFVEGGGGETVPYTLDPATMTAARMGDTSNASGGLLLFFGGEPTFSFVDPDVLYGVDWSDRHQLVSYRFSTATQRTIHDVQACLPGVAVHEGSVSVTKDDQRLLDYVGGSRGGEDTYVYAYDRTLGCRWLNTQTGQVGGAWGPTGTYRGDSGWLINAARISKNGKWAQIVASTASPAGLYLWNIETLDVIPCGIWQWPNYCDGYLVAGFDMLINQRGVGDAMDFAIRSMSAPDNARALIAPLRSPTDWNQNAQLSWNNVQADERQPVCMSVFRTDSLVLRVWDGEIVCAATDGMASTVWRFAHHRSQFVWFWDTPRANVSQDGRFALFTSNWGLMLGVGPAGFRDDAFIVQLAPPTQAGP